MSGALLRASGVGFAYGEHTILDDLDLELAPGRLLVVIGPNGAGKTTLLRLLTGVLPPARGEIELGGAPLAGLARREVARRLAVVPQELAVPFPFRVREMVAMGRAPHLGAMGREGERDRELTAAALRELGLDAFAERLYPTLSGGEKQRVLIARALAQTAPVLLLDEPTAHMDLGHRVHCFEWLLGWIEARAAERGALLITHDLVLGARFAHELLLIDAGRVVARGAPADVLTEERIAAVYGVEARVTRDEAERVVITAVRSRFTERFGYPPGRDESHR